MNSYTEDEIRVVFDIHHPTDDRRYDEPMCSCAPNWVPRKDCYYCHAAVNQDDPESTHHKVDCRIRPMIEDIPQMGVMRQEYTVFTADHFMERLLKLREIAGDGREESQQAHAG